MKVKFRTNIDHYNDYGSSCWPTNIDIPPRKGELVHVVDSFHKVFQNKKLPIRLEVYEVTWTEHGVICELWYSDKDWQIAKMNSVALL